MKLLRFGPPGGERPGLLDAQGQLRDLTGVIADLAGDTLSPASLDALRRLDPSTLPAVDGEPRIGPCVGRVGKFVCTGLNYADHAKESGVEIPVEPVLFMKPTSSIVGPDDGIVLPRGATKVDWEVELGVVIGSVARYVPEEDALRYVAGYCVINDVSERAFQLEGTGQWVKGKGADTFGPIGPWLVTSDEVPNPQALRLWLDVDGHRYQDSSTAMMVFGVAYLVSYASQVMSLHPGDIISTGTPPGIGMGKTPPVYLRAGNRLRVGIEGLGEQHQVVWPYDRADEHRVSGGVSESWEQTR
jgi:2-keto-4-pentenoate hydratase/2-oxohepta-3-ene-1,7-dioic acid hydratase in catechol pathway